MTKEFHQAIVRQQTFDEGSEFGFPGDHCDYFVAGDVARGAQISLYWV